MSSHNSGPTRASKKISIWVRIVSLLLLFAGLPLLGGGIYLITLGGSWYYAIAGLGLTLSAVQLWQGRMAGVRIFGLVFIGTLIWAVWEAGLHFWPQVPRLLAPIFLAGAVLLIVPKLKSEYGRPLNTRGYVLGGILAFIGFGIFIAAMFFPHDVLQKDFNVTEGEVSAASAEAGDDWPVWGRTGGGARYAPFDQITADNIGQLKVAWTARTGFIADQDEHFQDQTTPIYVDGTLYHCAPGGQISAIDGSTGEIGWQYDPKAESEDWKRCRVVAYFDPGAGDACGPRIVSTTFDSRLISVRASDGQLCDSFGENGTVDLFLGMGDTDPEFLTNSSGAVVVNGMIVLGGRVTDNVTLGEPSGAIRGYDATTGELAWIWDLGQPDLDAPLEEGDQLTPGTPNAWAPLAYDEDLDLVYIPLGNATPDIYGGMRRPFDDEYNSSVVALNAQTGTEVWRFQTTHHDLWDYDIPAQPVLADIPDGKGDSTPGLIMVTKRAQTFVLDRRTGAPLKTVEERPVPQGSGRVEGEYYAETQPFSVGMAAPGGGPLTEKMMWGATPIDQMICRILFQKYEYRGALTPPDLDWTIVYPGMLGGMNLGSAAVDEKRNVMIYAEMRMPMIQKLLPRKDVTPDMVYTGESGPFAPMRETPYALERSMFMSPIFIPCLQPPWGYVGAIDLASGEQIWQQPAGTSKDMGAKDFQPGIPFYMGMPPLAGPMVTNDIAWHAGFQDYYMRAYDVISGKQLWKARLPTGSQSTPMSYIGKDGRQYVVISASGARYNPNDWGDYVIAYALPAGGG